MVARGNNRNNGSSLGAAYLNANNALGNSNGSNWRSRLPLILPSVVRRRAVPGAEPATPLKAADSRHAKHAGRDAVKNVHERPVSRTAQAASKGGSTKGMGRAA